MAYEGIAFLHVVNFYLADAFEASGETDVLRWIGEEGKTLEQLIGSDASHELLDPSPRRDELDWLVRLIGIDTLADYLNDSCGPNAVEVEYVDGVLFFTVGDTAGTPWILTEHFQRERGR